MIKMPDTKAKFFSVRYSTNIQGAHYVPSVCYPLPQSLRATVEEMAAKGMARIYPEKVRFVTGVPYPVRKPEAGSPPVPSSSVSAPEAKTGKVTQPTVKSSPAPSAQTGRKSRRGAYTAQAVREFD